MLSIAPNESQLSADELAEACASRQANNSHELYCAALFHCALLTTDPRNAHCWETLIATYNRQVLLRVRQKAYNLQPQDIEDASQMTWLRFTKYYGLNKLAKADHISQVTSFLKSCAVSTAIDWIRRNSRHSNVDSLDADDDSGNDLEHDVSTEGPEQGGMANTDSNITDSVDNKLQHEKLMVCLRRACRNEADLIVAMLSFVEGYKPSHIYAAHPTRFKDVTDINERKRSILKRLRNDSDLLDLYNN